jgi:hypothetical protein
MRWHDVFFRLDFHWQPIALLLFEVAVLLTPGTFDAAGAMSTGVRLIACTEKFVVQRVADFLFHSRMANTLTISSAMYVDSFSIGLTRSRCH